ncbi:MAG: hypothetical protein U0457_14455 [Candidatus Sericytochromatia bacterium]
MNKKVSILFTICFLYFNLFLLPAFSTDKDYSQAAGHTGAYINVENVYALKCRIKTHDHTKNNNKLGWYTAWPMIVDYKTNKFVQIGYITSPAEKIEKPIFYVAWSDNGTQINIKYLPNKEAQGNALLPNDDHEYAMSLNSDGTVNIQIDGIKYLDSEDEMINVGITQGTGEFFSEGSNLNMDITTKFSKCSYKLRGDSNWKNMDDTKSILLYYKADGTSIESDEENSIIIKGKIKNINKGKFFKELKKLKKNKL